MAGTGEVGHPNSWASRRYDALVLEQAKMATPSMEAVSGAFGSVVPAIRVLVLWCFDYI